MLAKMNNFKGWIEETDPDRLKGHYLSLLCESGFNVCGFCEHHFKPQGYTALFLLSESHLAIHTFPERGKTYIELTSCVDEPFNEFMRLHDAELIEHD